MRHVRRYDIPYASSFVTVVTFGRQPILLIDEALFLESWKGTPPEAWVLLPDHFHALLPYSGPRLSHLVHSFKITYSRRFRDRYRPGRVWQNRFWDHFIRDSDDLRSHLDYIHFNAVKHGLAADPFGYGHSSIIKYAQEGFYDASWGQTPPVFDDDAFGE
jgi:putative transposase